MLANALNLAADVTPVTEMPVAIGNALTWIVNNVGTILNIVTGNIILSLGLAAWAIGLCISIYRRFV